MLIEDQIQRFSVSQHSQRHKKLIKYSHHTHQKPTDLMTMHPISVAGTNLQLENRHDKKDKICYNVFADKLFQLDKR